MHAPTPCSARPAYRRSASAFGRVLSVCSLSVLFSVTCCDRLLAAEPAAVLEIDALRLAVSPEGRVLEFVDRQSGENHVQPGGTECASVLVTGVWQPVTALTVSGDRWQMQFGSLGITAELRVAARPRHVVWEVMALRGEGVEEFAFCDIPLTLQGKPEEPWAACLLALNLQTNVAELPRPSRHLRSIAYRRFGFVGAAAAIVAGSGEGLRAALQEAVSAAPGLPHSPLGGPWAMDAKINRGSYLFNFDGITMAEVDQWIELAHQLGMTQIDFHGGSSFRFGDCRPNPARYPDGFASLKAVLDRLHEAGISVGLHTYAFFIAKDTPWVTPVPDPRLASSAVFTLASPLTADDVALSVSESTHDVSNITGFFVRNSVTLRIDEELITFTGVQAEAPFGFTGCQRGAYGTKASAHAAGAKVFHLKECFGLFVPDPETTMLAEVAAATAQAFNECGFDMIYFDALDGEDILGGAAWGWHYGARFVYEVWNRLEKPALIEMSTFHHHLWCVRSRLCAWDHPTRSHKRFIDMHNADNENSRRMFLPGELGWWALKNWTGPQGERTFPDDIEYLMTKALATDTGFALMGIDPTTAKSVPALPKLADIIRRYEDLRHAGHVPPALRATLNEPGAEFSLVGDVSRGWHFVPMDYAQHRVTESGGPSARWQTKNRFDAQPLSVRIEALMAAGPYDAPDNRTLCDFRDTEEFSQRSAQPGVTATLTTESQLVRGANTSGRLTAENQRTTADASWAMLGTPFSPTRDLSAHQALGVWVHGDGKGEVLNLQLRCPEHVVGNLADHYVPIDFTGWQYFELIEPEGDSWSQFQWPYGNLYSIYRESIQHGQISSLGLWTNRVPAGQTVEYVLSPIKALPLVKTRLINPTLRVGDSEVTFPVEMESGCYLECRGADDCYLYGPQGEQLCRVTPDRPLPQLAAGTNQLEFRCDSPSGIRARAYVTVITQGQPLDCP